MRTRHCAFCARFGPALCKRGGPRWGLLRRAQAWISDRAPPPGRAARRVLTLARGLLAGAQRANWDQAWAKVAEDLGLD